jgi:hypothetical protein
MLQVTAVNGHKKSVVREVMGLTSVEMEGSDAPKSLGRETRLI